MHLDVAIDLCGTGLYWNTEETEVRIDADLFVGNAWMLGDNAEGNFQLMHEHRSSHLRRGLHTLSSNSAYPTLVLTLVQICSNFEEF